MHGRKARNLPVWLPLSQTSKNAMFFFSKIGEQEGGTGSVRRRGREREVAQIMYTHVSKCKNGKIKILKNKVPHNSEI
jgi:hypothetical protein